MCFYLDFNLLPYLTSFKHCGVAKELQGFSEHSSKTNDVRSLVVLFLEGRACEGTAL